MSNVDVPEYPFGSYQTEDKLSVERRAEIFQQVADFPALLNAAVDDLSVPELEQVYRNWTVAQIVNHLADAQMNWFIRFKLALTVLEPTIMPYDQSDWVKLADATHCDLAPSLAIISGVNQRWAELGGWVLPEDFARTMAHPEHDQSLTLDHALSLSNWHCYHHLAQIQWLRKEKFNRVDAAST